MRKAVFFDIDGTIWDAKMVIPESTIRGIRELRANGNYAFLCSGRSRCAIPAGKLLDIGFDGILAGCGTYVEYHKETVFEKTIPYQELQEIQETLRRLGMPVLLEGSECIYLDEESFGDEPYLKYLKRILGENMKSVEEITETSKVNKMSALYHHADRAEVGRELDEKWEMVYHKSIVVEIMPKGFSKATGIKWICDYLGISHEDTYAFGDSSNDVEMLKYVKHGIVMGNGSEDAKIVADYVTTDIHEDGIYHALQHFHLI